MKKYERVEIIEGYRTISGNMGEKGSLGEMLSIQTLRMDIKVLKHFKIFFTKM